MKHKNIKKSQMHLEMIMSFIIFLGFLLVILYFINPLNSSKPSYTSFEIIENKILQNISITYQQASLILNNIPSYSCVQLTNGIPFASSNVIILDSNGKTLPRENSDSFTSLFSFDISSISLGADKRYFQLLLSNDFSNVPSSPLQGCGSYGSNQISFGSLTFEKDVLYESLVNFNNSYLNDYSSLKSQLGINKDFSFVVSDINKNILMNESLSERKALVGNAISRDIPLTMINKTGAKNQIILNLRVW